MLPHSRVAMSMVSGILATFARLSPSLAPYPSEESDGDRRAFQMAQLSHDQHTLPACCSGTNASGHSQHRLVA